MHELRHNPYNRIILTTSRPELSYVYYAIDDLHLILFWVCQATGNKALVTFLLEN